MPYDSSPTLHPLSLDLERVGEATEPAELGRLGRAICDQLKALPEGCLLPIMMLRRIKEAASRCFPLTPASDAVSGAQALQKRSPTDTCHRATLVFLPLRVAIIRLEGLQRTAHLGVTESQRQQQAVGVLQWLEACLQEYEQRREAVPQHLWVQLQVQIRQLNPQGELTAPARRLLVKLTPGQPPRLSAIDGSGSIVSSRRLMPPPGPDPRPR